jgi:aryl sulfotransferase
LSSQIIWLASFPKSGNTWLRAVYTALRWGDQPNINRLESPSPAPRAIFDQALAVRSADLSADEVDALRPRADEAAASVFVEDMLWKIHDALFESPDGELVVSTRATRCALYLIRDPRDVAVSWAHHADVPLAVAVEGLCSPQAALARSTRRLEDQVRQRLGTWSQHVRSWTEDPPFPVHVLRYEDCLADPVPTFHAAFTFAGVDASMKEMARAVERASFDRLSAQEKVRGFRERQSTRNPFFRSGTAGSWKETLPGDLAQRLLDEHGEVMASYGYTTESAIAGPSPTASRGNDEKREP